jgi:hypothetical protein
MLELAIKGGSLPMKRVTTFGSRTDRPWTTQFDDEISLLKIDVEYGEYPAVEQWLHESLNGRRSTVSQLQIEVHRLPFAATTSEVNITASSWWIASLRMQLLALGFLPVSQEKNSFGHCCFEFVFVHYRYFIRSESWMAASRADELDM